MGRMAAVLIAALGAEGGDLYLLSVGQHHDHAELGADLKGAAETRGHLLRHGIGDDIVIFGWAVQQPVTHTPPGKQGGIALFVQAANDFVCGITIGHRVLATN